jgi:hypothetical protein
VLALVSDDVTVYGGGRMFDTGGQVDLAATSHSTFDWDFLIVD